MGREDVAELWKKYTKEKTVELKNKLVMCYIDKGKKHNNAHGPDIQGIQFI